MVGRWYARGFSSNEVKKAFHAWNVLNQPPMSKAEVTSILSSTLKWEICRRDAFNVEKFPKMKPKPLTDEELAALPKDLRNEILALRKRNKIKNIGDKNDKIKIR